jgi:hypothetical protein
MAHTCNFILLGAGRSGTSLLAAQINQHSKITCGFEDGAVNILSNPPASIFLRNTPKGKMKALLTHCYAMAKQSQKPLYGNKITTEQLLLPSPGQPEIAAKTFVKTFYRVPVIFLLRDGRTCIPSKVNRGGKTLEEAITYWEQSVLIHNSLLQNHASVLVLKYEELLQQPDQQLIKVCKFLGVTFEPAMMAATSSAILPEMYKNEGLRIEKALVHKEEDWHKRIKPTLVALGY